MEKKRLISAIQPSGNLHIGNYLGAVQQWVKMQEEYDAFLFAVDLHTITVPQDPETLRKKTLEIIKIYLSAGIDPEKCTLFVQSHVGEHVELGWILSTIARMGELERMTQFKDKSAKEGAERAGVGLFTYPVLMAADILLYDTSVVPVGKDQMQHIELARTLAERFNKRFGPTFVLPEGKLSKEGALIMALDDPTKKMSKSATSEYNYIALTDEAETVRRKIKKAVTDSGSEIVYREDKPALKNLINIYSLLSGMTPQEVEAKYADGPDSAKASTGKYAEFKNGLAETITGFLEPFQEKMKSLDDEQVLEILEQGAVKARTIASEKMKEVRGKIGLLPGKN